ncbi:N-acetyltransferase family protein [Streptomyces sp. N2-109]|uniref:N-acetyltransferase family protein n=1 Tax=Streptomyces gossypii TaxID=2883101 RepID=A0ABT2K0E5_9ACTN|nr:GNAT family N-acetyltransferase [Streptomyces gossypii]MCT2593104.1 N-acetyltransferase family protein [Streptomyces gossypii]
MTDSTEIEVRAAREGDLEELTSIYNHFVRETPATFDIEPFTPEERRPWLLSHHEDGPHRLLVASATGKGATPGGRVLGYAHSSRFRPKAAYDTSVECTVYAAPHAGGRGIGTLLYKHLFEILDGQDLHRAYAGITVPNEASVRLHRRFGFELCGTYGQAGRKFGRYYDVQRFEKAL